MSGNLFNDSRAHTATVILHLSSNNTTIINNISCLQDIKNNGTYILGKGMNPIIFPPSMGK